MMVLLLANHASSLSLDSISSEEQTEIGTSVQIKGMA